MPPRHGRLNPQRRAMASQMAGSGDSQPTQQPMQQQQELLLDIEDRIAAIQKVYEEKARNMEIAFEQKLADIQQAYEQSLSNLENLHTQKFVNVYPEQAEGIQNVSIEKAKFESELRKVEFELAGKAPNGTILEDYTPRDDAASIKRSVLKTKKRALQLQLMELTRDSTEITIRVDLEMHGKKATEVDPSIRHSPFTLKIDRTRTMNDLRVAIERDLKSFHASSRDDNFGSGGYKVVSLLAEFINYASGQSINSQYDTLLQQGIVDFSIVTAKIKPSGL